MEYYSLNTTILLGSQHEASVFQGAPSILNEYQKQHSH